MQQLHLIFLLILVLSSDALLSQLKTPTRQNIATTAVSSTKYWVRSTILRVSSPSSTPPDSGSAKKYKCVSCSYVFDEALGFKKRVPPGTKFTSLQVFMCPVCGAAKDQFREIDNNGNEVSIKPHDH